MNRVYIHSNPSRDVGGAVKRRVGDMLARRGIACVDTPEKSDTIICLGGDGTILNVASEAARLDIPVLGINLGNIGFMTAFDADRLNLLDGVLDGEFLYDRRMLLTAETESSHSFVALNDAALNGPPGRTLEVRLTVGGRHAAAIRGDGMIASTPTGSTAYSMSAGGPITDPRADCLIFTPVCAHTPYARPIVIPAAVDAVITCGGETTLTVDGEIKATIAAGSAVRICRAHKKLSLIRLKNYDFYDIMSKKLWNLGEDK